MTEHCTIAVATTGGDAPGMNACIAAIVNAARTKARIVGVRDGALGIIRDRQDPPDYFHLTIDRAYEAADRAGSMLGSARAIEVVGAFSLQTMTTSYYKECASLELERLKAHGVDGVILLGGDGTCQAALALHEQSSGRVPVVVVPATIDNDVAKTPFTIGFLSAVSEAVHAIDRIRETAMAMRRIFIIEVMGRGSGEIAAHAALAGSADAVFVPEHGPYSPSDIERVACSLREAAHSAERSAIAVVAEAAPLPGLSGLSGGVAPAVSAGSAGYRLEHLLGECFARLSLTPVEIRTTILGHLQRGAKPTAMTRFLAMRAGIAALDEIVDTIRRGRDAGADGPVQRAPRLISISSGLTVSAEDIANVTQRKTKRSVMELVALVERLSHDGGHGG